MADASPEKSSGCGILSAVFGRKKTTPAPAPTQNNVTNNVPKVPTITNNVPKVPNITNSEKDRTILRPNPNNQTKVAPQNKAYQPPNVYQQKANPSQGYNQARKVPQGSTGISGELDSMIQDHQKSNGSTKLVRASSSNVMLHGNLGNLRTPRSNGNTTTTTTSTADTVLDFLPKTAHEEPTPQAQNGKYSKNHETSEKPAVSLCRAISTRMDPEQLKILGNEDYKNGNFAEALALYDAAISIDPSKASYRSNKSAALAGLGRLLEAVFECREAIRIEPFYQRAHNRLATLYVRLGEVETALYHYKQAGSEADPDVMTKAKNIQVHLNTCTEAKRQRDWNTLLKETSLAISAGADSAPQIFAFKAEALLKNHRYQDADETLKKGPNFDADECTKFLGPIGNAGVLAIRAQVDLASGRIDDAVEAAQRAAHLDANNKEVSIVARRTRAVATARSNGNELFKAGKFSEACTAYGEGLDHDPYNSVLLCNRAACRSKLGQFEKALEDCNAALSVRPSFSKARLRRADCCFKMGKWKACIQECETMMKDSPENEEVSQMMKDAHLQLNKGRSQE